MLPYIAEPPPGQSGLNTWIYHHAKDHEELRQAVQARLGINLPLLVLDPLVPQDVKGWLERHQQSHNNFNAVLGLNGNDLSVVDFNNRDQAQAWFWLNFQEHQSAHQALAI